MPERSPGVRNKSLLRSHAIASGGIALLAAAFFLLSDVNFPRMLGLLTLGASVLYFLFALFFEFFCRTACIRTAGVALSLIGVGVITVALCYSGGIASPFIFLYFSMLIAEALYGLQNPYTMPASIAGYLLVVSGHYFGFLPNFLNWPVGYYHSPIAVLSIAGITVAYLALTGSMSARIIETMRARLQDEANDREALVKKFSELNSTTQLGILAHRIAHDLRGPIGSISGYLELKLAAEKDPVERDTLQEVQESVDGMVSSLHNITRFGKPSGPSREEIDLGSFFKSLIAIASFSPKARGVDFSVKAEGDGDLSIEASKSDLQQAFFNILKNAVEAVSDNSDLRKVEIRLCREEKNVSVTIADNGPGMPQELLDSLFRKSFTTKKEGTGVGLMITRDLLVRNDGDIKVRNREAGGVEVKVALLLAHGNGAKAH